MGHRAHRLLDAGAFPVGGYTVTDAELVANLNTSDTGLEFGTAQQLTESSTLRLTLVGVLAGRPCSMLEKPETFSHSCATSLASVFQVLLRFRCLKGCPAEESSIQGRRRS